MNEPEYSLRLEMGPAKFDNTNRTYYSITPTRPFQPTALPHWSKNTGSIWLTLTETS